jgi:hypothetical protein
MISGQVKNFDASIVRSEWGETLVGRLLGFEPRVVKLKITGVIAKVWTHYLGGVRAVPRLRKL